MATESETGTIQSFGQISRTKGTLFRYLLLAATLFGLVVLSVLFVYVGLDAIQPTTAAPGWYLTFFLTFVLPVGAVSAYLWRSRPESGEFALASVAIPVYGLMIGAVVAMVFIDIYPPLLLLSYAIGAAIPAAIAFLYARLRSDAGDAERLGLAAVVTVASLATIPPLVQSIPVIPTDWIMMLLALGTPTALGVGAYVARRYENERAGRATALVVFVAAAVGGVLAPLVGVDPMPGVVLTLSTVVPTGLYVGTTLYERPARRSGLLLPAAVFGGALVGAVLVNQLGFAGPESWVDWQFLTSDGSTDPESAGLYPGLVGSVLLMLVVVALSFPLGVGAAVYLEEYAPNNRLTRLIQVNISNLAGVPSVVYGLLGLGVFINIVALPTGSLIVGGMTLSLLILPIVIISTQEALRSVPDDLRQASYGMGATRWQTIRNVVLPRAMPGILTGTILALGRAIGETAPLIMILAPNSGYVPSGLFSKASAMPLMVYTWAGVYADPVFYQTAVAAGVVVMLVVLLAMNGAAIVLRNRYQTRG
ncbi:phosphate ABC transporter permease PstA [Halomarina pelagica]|uniref:phosphate ABC transporter permease PstA n=1 Tax=Halomarina pelagica TaxID=2961599 RepID=UPI0020C3C96B|nr:phosphate ABC transporter permease PstA [Halomarina sp. BND7]